MQAPDTRPPQFSNDTYSRSYPRNRDRGFAGLSETSTPGLNYDPYTSMPTYPSLPPPPPGKATPPPIDPGVFRSVTNIRKLIDEASELAVRASSGLSAAALGSMRSSANMSNSPWALAQSLGLNPLGEGGNNPGRNVAMSAMRIHRLRALAVQKLAQAYRADEIASSVMVMQGGSVFDDLASRVLKTDPNDADAQYVHFFHEKIPSRQLAESTPTKVLDDLIRACPHQLELFRTRGIVHTFRDEFGLAVKDFTYALKEARALRKANAVHRTSGTSQSGGKGSNKKKGKGGGTGKKRGHGQAPRNGTGVVSGGGEENGGSGGTTNGMNSEGDEPPLVHPSVLPDAPEPIEPQVLFLRGAVYLQHAVFLIEQTILRLENVRKAPTADGVELRLCHLENGRYGGVEIGNPDGPLGRSDGEKFMAYRRVLKEDETFREQILGLVRKSVRDHDKFLSHFDSLEIPSRVSPQEDDLPSRTARAFTKVEALRPGYGHTHPQPSSNASTNASAMDVDPPPPFTTYHPLLVEAHFSILIAHLLLGNFEGLVKRFVKTASVVDGLEGYPVFLPPRSMAQAEFVEILERLAGGWKVGSVGVGGNEGRLAIEPPLPSPLEPSMEETASYISSSSTTTPSPPPESIASTSNGTQETPASSIDPNTHQAEEERERESKPPQDEEDNQDCDKVIALTHLRMMLAPVVLRQRQKAMAEEGTSGLGSNGKKKNGAAASAAISIPLHGPRVEIVLAWTAAVWLGELEEVA